MAPTFLSESDRGKLIAIARSSIDYGLNNAVPINVDTNALSDELRSCRASFVTLKHNGQLRGCIGTLQATLPLARDVALHAFEAAFKDPRFANVTPPLARELDIHISVLTPMEALTFVDEADLLRQLRPGQDGLLIDDGRRRATFLPSVWEELVDPISFLTHLKLKAGIWEDGLPSSFSAYRYETESFP